MSVLGVGVDPMKEDEFGSHEAMKGNQKIGKGRESGGQETMKGILFPIPGFLASRLVLCFVQ